jgi:hypothetical protein
VALPALAVAYRADLEYRYEVPAIILTWVPTIAGGILLARWFRSTVAPPSVADPPARDADVRHVPTATMSGPMPLR